jgi:hypothetical protein
LIIAGLRHPGVCFILFTFFFQSKKNHTGFAPHFLTICTSSVVSALIHRAASTTVEAPFAVKLLSVRLLINLLTDSKTRLLVLQNINLALDVLSAFGTTSDNKTMKSSLSILFLNLVVAIRENMKRNESEDKVRTSLPLTDIRVDTRESLCVQAKVVR